MLSSRCMLLNPRPGLFSSAVTPNFSRIRCISFSTNVPPARILGIFKGKEGKTFRVARMATDTLNCSNTSSRGTAKSSTFPLPNRQKCPGLDLSGKRILPECSSLRLPECSVLRFLPEGSVLRLLPECAVLRLVALLARRNNNAWRGSAREYRRRYTPSFEVSSSTDQASCTSTVLLFFLHSVVVCRRPLCCGDETIIVISALDFAKA